MNYIVSIHSNNTELLETQYKSIKKFLKKSYKYIVFIDEETNNILNKCNELNISYVLIPQNIHKDRNLVFNTSKMSDMRKIMNNDIDHKKSTTNEYIKSFNFNGYNSAMNNSAGSRHCDSIQFIINYFINNKIDVLYLMNLDSDMFFIKNFDINKITNKSDILCVLRSRKYKDDNYWEYMWPNLFIINIKNCPNLHEICFDGVFLYNDKKKFISSTDTGGETGFYLQKYKDLIKLETIDTCLLTPDNISHFSKDDLIVEYYNEFNKIKNDTDQVFKEVCLKNSIFHLRGIGSNWIANSKNYNQKQIFLFRKIFKI